MNNVYAKLISKDKIGTLTGVFPEVQCDLELDLDRKESDRPVANYVIVNALNDFLDDAKNYVKTAFSSPNSGLSWNPNTQTAYVTFDSFPDLEFGKIAAGIINPTGALKIVPETGKLDVDFSKFTAADALKLCSTNGAIIASTEAGANNGKMCVDFTKLPKSFVENIVISMLDPNGAVILNDNDKLDVDWFKIPTATYEDIDALMPGI